MYYSLQEFLTETKVVKDGLSYVKGYLNSDRHSTCLYRAKKYDMKQ